MKKQIQESLDRIKFLNEFHFKPHGRDSVTPNPVNDEMPVKFNEVGDTYKYQEEEHDYPSWEQYRNDVLIDEEDPEPNEPQNGQNPPAQAPAGQEPPAQQMPPAPAPDASAAPAAMPEPPPAPMPPAPVTAPPMAATPEPDMFASLTAQMAKTDEMLAKFDQVQSQLAGMETVNMKLTDVEKKLEDLKNPPYEDQLEMISKQAYPYNIKLSDFWGWDKDDEMEEIEDMPNFKLNPDEVNNYNKDDIKKSFGA